MNLDDVDRKLLRAVQRDNRVSGERLTGLVGLSSTACQRRLARLRAAGVIGRDISLVSTEAVGRRLTLVIGVTLERERADIVDAFKRVTERRPEIMTGYYPTGDIGFLLTVTAIDMADHEAFTRRFS